MPPSPLMPNNHWSIQAFKKGIDEVLMEETEAFSKEFGGILECLTQNVDNQAMNTC